MDSLVTSYLYHDPLGEIAEVGPSTLIARIHPDSKGILHVGSYVVIPTSDVSLFGQVSSLKVSSRFNDLDQPALVAEVEIVSSLFIESMKVVSGVVCTPSIGSPLYAPSAELLQFVLSGFLPASGARPVQINLGVLPDAFSSALRVTPERVIGRHLAVVGTTGGGKSWSLARIVEQCAEHKSKVILIDPTGEYSSLRGTVQHIHFGEPLQEEVDSKAVALPYFHLTEQDLIWMFRPKGPSQAPKLRAAMKSLKLAAVSGSVGVDGMILKAHKPKKPVEQSYRRHQAEVENPYASFDITKLTRQIENECVQPQRSSTEPDVWGGINGFELGECMSMVGRIDDMISSPQLRPIFQPQGKESLLEVLHLFLRDPELSVLRINMQFLSFAFGARTLVANALGRHLFELSAKGTFRRRPLLVVMDEAHQFLGANSSGVQEEAPAGDIYSLIAKEGRKYSLALCIATQRPRDIPEDVLSQMGTMLIHRLINSGDREIIERACGEIDQATLKRIPTLSPGEAILAGVYFPIPLHVRVYPPDCRPQSEGADYQSFWAS
jgi:hypothetical protein